MKSYDAMAHFMTLRPNARDVQTYHSSDLGTWTRVTWKIGRDRWRGKIHPVGLVDVERHWQWICPEHKGLALIGRIYLYGDEEHVSRLYSRDKRYKGVRGYVAHYYPQSRGWSAPTVKIKQAGRTHSEPFSQFWTVTFSNGDTTVRLMFGLIS